MSRLSESNGLAAVASDKELKQVKEITNLDVGKAHSREELRPSMTMQGKG
jgi:hypothetical protein